VKRPVGVVVAAILLLVGSLFQLLMALCMALSALVSGAQMSFGTGATTPTWMPLFMYTICGFFIGLAAWGIVTTVGLFRMRTWARYSILVIGGGIAVIGFFSAVTTVLMAFIPMPLPPSPDGSQLPNVQVFMRVIFGVIALFHGSVAALGVYWLVYFNRKRVCAAFSAAANPSMSSELAVIGAADGVAQFAPTPEQTPDLRHRPLLISVLAVLDLIGAFCCLVMTLLPIPGLFLGMQLNGWRKTALFLAFTVIQALVGIGLWRLHEWGRRLALVMTILGALQCGVYLLRP